VAKIDYPFPEDEFDAAGEGRAPEGVHRARQPRWRVLLPFLIVVLLAPVLAYAGVSYLAGRGDSGGSAVTASPAGDVLGQAAVAAGETPAPVATAPAPTPTPEPTPQAPPVARDARVVALNGTRTGGLAAGAAARLQADGFTAVTVGNARSRVPTASTVYYNNAGLAPSAQRAAAVLGIGRVVENSSATPSIAIVLRSDYRS
jgi:hypothetical protein